MAHQVAARRYAQAVFELGKRDQELDRWLSELELISEAVSEPGVAAFMADPGVPFEKKHVALGTLLDSFSPLALNLAYLLIRRGRLQAVGDIHRELQQMVNEWRGIEVAEVVTAFPLDAKRLSDVSFRLERLTGKKIILREKVDPGIIGGIIVRVGDNLIDGSVKGKMQTLRQRLN